MAQSATVDGRTASRRPGRRPSRDGSAPRVHLGRLAILVLVLIGASFYVAPLKAFFTQQDRYQHEAAALQTARADNTAYKVEVQLLGTKDYVGRRARLDSNLVPPDTQLFVIRGLPGRDTVAPVVNDTQASAGSISVLDRINDLWRTLLH